MQQNLVGADHVRFRSPFDSLVRRDMIGPKTVVVEKEERGEQARGAFSRPEDIRILGGQHVIVPTYRNQAPVLCFPPQAASVRW